MARSLFLPVWQLEGQRGPAARRRRRVLGARTYGSGCGSRFVCVNVAGIWSLGMFMIARLLIPEDALPAFSLADPLRTNTDALWLQYGTNLVAFIADT
jgi:hypothetical protein